MYQVVPITHQRPVIVGLKGECVEPELVVSKEGFHSVRELVPEYRGAAWAIPHLTGYIMTVISADWLYAVGNALVPVICGSALALSGRTGL
jgi:hypothetical protein